MLRHLLASAPRLGRRRPAVQGLARAAAALQHQAASSSSSSTTDSPAAAAEGERAGLLNFQRAFPAQHTRAGAGRTAPRPARHCVPLDVTNPASAAGAMGVKD